MTEQSPEAQELAKRVLAAVTHPRRVFRHERASHGMRLRTSLNEKQPPFAANWGWPAAPTSCMDARISQLGAP